MSRPDFSNYLAHFTKDGVLSSQTDDNPAKPFERMNAFDRLISILNAQIIKASTMPWTGAHAACFTECPWTSLLGHTKQYSCYGIGFSKKVVFAKHGGPAYYVRPDHLKKQMSQKQFDKHVWPFVTPFAPLYRPTHMKGQYFPTVDYSHEREWRVPHDYPFLLEDIEFIVVKDSNDLVRFPQDLLNAIGIDKFIIMDNYKFIETLWPVHII